MANTAQELTLRIGGDSTAGQKSVKDIEDALKSARKELEDIEKAFAGVGASGAATFQKEIEAAQGKVATLEAALKTAKPAVQGVGDEFERTAPKVDDATKKLEKLASTLTGAATPLHSIGTSLTAAITGPLVGAAVAGEHFAADFQTQMTRVQTLAGAGGAEVAGMRDKVLALGPAVGIGPAELAKGLFVLESAGQRGQQALDTLTVSGKMSAIGMGETSEVARSLIGVMLSYQQQNLSAAQAGDILVKTVQLGNMKIDELVPALARVNPLAAAMGIKFQDVAAAIATFTHMGASSEVAATGLRAILSNILNDSAKTEKGFALLSSTLGDSTISMKNFRKSIADDGLAQALIDLMEKANAAGEKGMESLNKIFPNIKALTEVLANAKANGTMYLAVTRSMYDANGTLNDSFAETQKTFDQHWKELKATLDVLLITLGDSLLPTFQNVVDVIRTDFVPVLKNLADGFKAQPEPIKDAIIAVGGIAAIVGPAVYVLGTLVGAAGSLVSAFAKVPAAIAAVQAGLAMLEGTVAGMLATTLAITGLIAAVGGLSYALTRLVDTVSGGKLSGWLTPFLSGTEDLALKTQEAGASADAFRLATERSGHAVTSLSEAMRINEEWDKQRITTLKAAADAQHGHTTALTDSAAAHKTLAEQVKALTADTREDIEAKRQQGYSIKAISTETGIATEVISAFLKQQAGGLKGTKAYSDALKEYNSVGANYRDTIDQMSGAVVEGIKYDLARGESQTVLEKIYGVTKEQIHAIVEEHKNEIAIAKDVEKNNLEIHKEALKILAERVKEEKIAHDEINKAVKKNLDEADKFEGEHFDYLNKLSLNHYDYERFKVDEWKNTQLGALDYTREGWERAYAAIEQVARDKYAQIVKDEKLAIDQMQAQEKTWLNDFPKLLQQALTGGGGFAGAVKAFGADLGSQLGLEITQGPIGESLYKGFSALFDRGGKASSAIANGIQGAIQAAVSIAGSGSFGDVVSYTAVGAEIGFMIGHGIGAAIGASVGAIVGIIKSIDADEKQINAVREAFVIASGGIDDLAKAAKRAGVDLHAFLDAKEPAAYEKALKSLTDAITFQDSAMATLADTVKKYGFTIDELGPAMQKQNLQKQAEQLWQDWQVLNAAGIDTVAITTRMGSSINDYFHLAMKTHTEIPVAMKSMLQAMIDAGTLTDENGEKITDLNKTGVTFSETMTEGFNRVVDVVKKLADAIERGLGLAIKGIPDTKTIHFKYTTDPIPPPPSGDGGGDPGDPGKDPERYAARGGWITAHGVDPEYMASGGFPGRPRGIDRIPVWAAEDEAFLNRIAAANLGPARIRALNAGMRLSELAPKIGTVGATPLIVNVNVEGNVRADHDLADVIFQRLADVFSLSGGAMPLSVQNG